MVLKNAVFVKKLKSLCNLNHAIQISKSCTNIFKDCKKNLRLQIQKFPAFKGTQTPSDTPCECKWPIGADGPPNHPPNVEDGSTPLIWTLSTAKTGATSRFTLNGSLIDQQALVENGFEWPQSYLKQWSLFVKMMWKIISFLHFDLLYMYHVVKHVYHSYMAATCPKSSRINNLKIQELFILQLYSCLNWYHQLQEIIIDTVTEWNIRIKYLNVK